MNKPEVLYNKVLNNIIYPKLGKGVTNELQLTKLGKKLIGDSFLGVYAANDNLPKLYKDGQCFIMNLDNKRQPGSHWIAGYYENPILGIYDSFGRETAKILPILYNKHFYKIVDSDYDAEQKIDEDDCGQRSLSFLYIAKTLGLRKALTI